MARDKALEALVNEELASLTGITEKAMFGGLAWLWRGNLLVGASNRGLLLRIGESNEEWALKIPGVIPMMNGQRRMRGYVRAGAEVYVSDTLRGELISAAIQFVRGLPKK